MQKKNKKNFTTEKNAEKNYKLFINIMPVGNKHDMPNTL